MTRTYDDIEAVSRLLEEKEKDLELTVQIGKELLQQNNRLEGRVTELEHDLKECNENLAQMQHDLHQKSDLIAILTSDAEDRSEGSEWANLSISQLNAKVTFSLSFQTLPRRASRSTTTCCRSASTRWRMRTRRSNRRRRRSPRSLTSARSTRSG